MIRAGQPSGLHYRSQLTAAYPKQVRSNMMRAELAGVIENSGLDEYQELTSKGFLPLTGALCFLDSEVESVDVNCGLRLKRKKGNKLTVITGQKRARKEYLIGK